MESAQAQAPLTVDEYLAGEMDGERRFSVSLASVYEGLRLGT